MTDDLFRVIYTRADGKDLPLRPMSREAAMACFDRRLAQSAERPWTGVERVRVMSDHEWCKVRPLGGAG